MACENRFVEPDASAMGYDYFPVGQGSYRIYRVKAAEYSILGEIVASDYFVKEVIADSALNLAGEYTYLLNRYIRQTENDEWRPDSVRTILMDRTRATVTENNVPFVKMVFPLRENKEWNGNAFNTRGEELYKMTSVGRGVEIGDVAYPHAVTIVQMDNPDTLLARDKRIEIYGKEIGLLYKETVQLNYCSDIDCIGEGIIESGFTYSMELVDYGKE